MSAPAIMTKKKFVRTIDGNIAYLEAGGPASPPVLFVHGIPTSSYLWRHVMRFMAPDFHCLAPDLMGLGDTEVDPARTAFHMEAQAEMLASFMSALGHETFALVCHDQGGAAAQLLAARMPERITCFAITDCVCYDNWPVPAIARLQRLARLPVLADVLARLGVIEWVETRTPLSRFRRGVFRRDRLGDDAIREYLRPLREGPEQRERFLRFLLAGHPRYSLAAVAGLRTFERPTLVVWAADDRYLSPSWGRKLFEEIPGAERFELVPFCGHFWQEERPGEFASHITAFLARHTGNQARDADETRPIPLCAAPARQAKLAATKRTRGERAQKKDAGGRRPVSRKATRDPAGGGEATGR